VASDEILLLCRPFLGDIALLRPVLDNLRGAFPGARIVAATYPDQLAALELHSQIDEVLALPHRRPESRRTLVVEWARFAAGMSKRRFLLLYDLLQNDRSALIATLTRAKQRVTYCREKPRARHRIYTHVSEWRAEHLETRHVSKLYLKPLEEIGVPITSYVTRLDLRAEDQENVRARLERARQYPGRPLVVVHPGAGAPSKCWPAADFAAICDEIVSDLGGEVLLLAGLRDQDRLLDLGAMMRTMPTTLDGPLGPGQLAALLGAADLFVGHDSGPMHVAACVGTRVVAIYGSSSVVHWAPVGMRHHLLQAEMPCTACVEPELCRPGDPYRTYCVQRVPRKAVSDAIREQLQRLRGHPDRLSMAE
jgi:heptosyltransferase III